jgi:hypothetical protein
LKLGPFYLTLSEQFVEMVENATYLEEWEPRELKQIQKFYLRIPILMSDGCV